MKKFVSRILLFLLIFCSVYGVILGRYIYKMHSFSFELPKNKTTLVIGDSQTQAAIDDNRLSNMANVSQAHDNYFTMLRRMKLYIEANEQIDTVIIGLTPHTTAYFKDEFFTNYGYIDYVTKYYMPYMSFSEWWVIITNDISDVVSSLFTPIKFYLNVNRSYIYDMGHFEVADYSHLQEDIKEGATRLTGGDVNSKTELSNQLTIHYLHEIVDYCRDNNIKLIGLNTPVYNSRKYMRVDAFYALMNKEFQDVELWDYMDVDIPDEYRRDVNHLNRQGAEWMSEEIKEKTLK